jgi:hypothetical protein
LNKLVRVNQTIVINTLPILLYKFGDMEAERQSTTLCGRKQKESATKLFCLVYMMHIY